MEKKTTPRDYAFKYEGKNPFDKLRPGEPYFFIRAQDKFSLDALIGYRDALRTEADSVATQNDQEFDAYKEKMKQAISISIIIKAFMDWQEDNPALVKVPDIFRKEVIKLNDIDAGGVRVSYPGPHRPQ